MTAVKAKRFTRDPLWYKDAVIYQLHVRAFFDSDGDGIGDFRGLIRKLDYLKDLGINTIWLLPFYPSPMKDEGYDISDYEGINPSYGTLRDFSNFLSAAHQRGIRVITELVINHTSDQHGWFQKSRRDKPGGRWRNFYVWSDDPRKYKGVRIIFRDFEPSNWTYDPVAKSYYWHRFFSHQPDLNFDNPEVKKRIFRLVDYWMKMGVDGMRLDAVPYLFEREGTSCENLPETHAFLKDLRAYLDARYPDRLLLAEANQWPDDAAAYFGDGDECHMNFHFPIMPRLFMAVKREDRFSIIDIIRQTPDIPDNCQWAMFLRNHDELTLEMVTDEERDFMYKAYATDDRARINFGIRRRLAPLLNNDRRQIELLNGLLFSLPGTPIIYYGDEIGMGDNIYLGDRNGVRTPFQWNSDRNAGFSAADPQQLFLPVVVTPEYHYTTVNVETQNANPNSLMRWVRALVDLRKQSPALTRGKLKFLTPDNEKVLAFVREHEGGQTVLVLANLSRRAQYAELDLLPWRGAVPVEMRGETPFPAIGDLPYVVTQGPHDFYWFDLTGIKTAAAPSIRAGTPVSRLPAPDKLMDQPGLRQDFERMLKDYLPKARWFAAKSNTIRNVALYDVVNVGGLKPPSALVIVNVTYRDLKDKVDTYLLTVALSEGADADGIIAEYPDLIIGVFDLEAGGRAVYHEALIDAGFSKPLLQAILRHGHHHGRFGALTAQTMKPGTKKVSPEPAFLSREQSNSSLRFGDEYFLKIYRRLEEGINPEIEIGAHLTKAGFTHAPALVGSLSYQTGRRTYSLAVVHEFTAGKSSGWDFFKTRFEEFSSLAEKNLTEKYPAGAGGVYDLDRAALPGWFLEATDGTAGLMRLLGQRTGELHAALGVADAHADFAPEEYTSFYQRSLYQSLRNRALQTRLALERKKRKMPETDQALADRLLAGWDAIDRQFDGVRRKVFSGKRIFIHGDFHLGQVMFTGQDFVIIDFEGEPQRPISTRRLKRAPLVDVAGLMRSIDYLVRSRAGSGAITPWQRLWGWWMSRQFLEGYQDACAGSGLLPEDDVQRRYMTEVFEIEKALYEIEYEISSRPDWLGVPLRGLIDLLPTLSVWQERPDAGP